MKHIHRTRLRMWGRLLLSATAAITLWVVATACGPAQDETPQIATKPDVQTMIEKIRAAGEPTSAAQLDPPDVPDKDNAFLLYKKASAKVTNASDVVDEAASRLAAISVREWSSKDVATLRAYVKENAEAIALAREGAQLAGYKSDSQWRLGPAMPLPQLAQMRKLARLLCYKARVDLADGHIEEAIKTCADALRVAGHTSAEPVLIGRLVEIACRDIAMGVFSQILACNKNTALAESALRTLTELASKPRLRNVLIAERATAIGLFEEMRTGKTAAAGVLGESALAAEATPDMIAANEIIYLENIQGFIDLADKPYYEVSSKLKTLESDAKKRSAEAPLASMLLPVLSRVYESDAMCRARADVMRAAAALKLYKLQHLGYPRALAELVPKMLPKVPIDEFSGEPLKYMRLGDGFVVYSVGLDLTDDMGYPGNDKRSGDITYTEE